MTSSDKTTTHDRADTTPVAAQPQPNATQSPRDISINELAARLRPLLNRLVLIYYRQSVHTALTASQLSILSVLEHHGPMRISDIAKFESIRMPTASNAIHRLEHDGFVVRERDRHDRRGVTVALTEHGRHELDRVNAQRNIEFARFISHYTEDDKELALELTEILERILTDHDGRRGGDTSSAANPRKEH